MVEQGAKLWQCTRLTWRYLPTVLSGTQPQDTNTHTHTDADDDFKLILTDLLVDQNLTQDTYLLSP